MEDVTDPETMRKNPKSDRCISFYGYMRGVPLKNKTTVHLPGQELLILDYLSGTVCLPVGQPNYNCIITVYQGVETSRSPTSHSSPTPALCRTRQRGGVSMIWIGRSTPPCLASADSSTIKTPFISTQETHRMAKQSRYSHTCISCIIIMLTTTTNS